jgi:hypothetical protein
MWILFGIAAVKANYIIAFRNQHNLINQANFAEFKIKQTSPPHLKENKKDKITWSSITYNIFLTMLIYYYVTAI